jgi:hypothetical protein
MSFCVKCGWEYDEKLENNFCAKCGFDLRKDASVQSELLSTTASAHGQTDKKPIAGIIVAVVLGIIGLLWSFAVLFHSLYGSPSSIQIALQQIFPSLQIKTYIGLSFALIGNSALLIGGLMAYFSHPAGAKTVRITAYSMIAATALLTVLTLFATIGDEAWPTLDAPTKGALIGGLIGGVIGAVLQWGLMLFLFRAGAKSKLKTLPPVLPKRMEPPLKPIEKVLNTLLAIPCALITLSFALVIIVLPFDKDSYNDISSLIGGIIGCAIFGSIFGWITFKCYKALAR